MVEYAMVLGLIALVVVGLLQWVGKSANGAFCEVSQGLASRPAGYLAAFGLNGNGQLGNGSTTNSATPKAVPGICAESIATGAYHDLAVKTDGTIWSWGLGGNGQLGNGSTTNAQTTPVQVSNGLTGTAVAAGSWFSAAIGSDGTVWTWGQDLNGELGDGAGLPGPNIVATPVHVLAGGCGACGTYLSGVTAIAAGFDYAVALRSDGTVWTWGQAQSNGTASDSSTPLEVVAGACGTCGAYLNGITAVTAGGNFALARRSDGAVYAWGSSTGGLGNGVNTSFPPVSIFSSGVTAVGAGWDHALVSKTDGTVWTWGTNDLGQLGQGGAIPGTNSATPIAIGGLTSITSVAASKWGYSLAVDGKGTLYTWGYNADGELGNGSCCANTSTPAGVTVVSVVGLAGWSNSLVLTRQAVP